MSVLGGCNVLERTDFQECLCWEDANEQFLLWKDVMFLKELIYNSFYFGRVWWF